jgi:tartrate-resistant acid phosphatase type 5
MFNKDRQFISVRIVLALILIAGGFGVRPVRASAEISTELVPERNPNDSNSVLNLSSTGQTCSPNGGWVWTNGPFKPDIATQVQYELKQMGIDARVEARSYGETDNCGTYSEHGIDFTITLAGTASPHSLSRQGLADEILPILVKFGKPALGNVKLISAEGEIIPINTPNKLSTPRSSEAEAPAADVITRKVYVVVYDPLLSNGQTLTQYKNWNDHAVITQQTIDLFKQATNDKMNFVVVDTTLVTSGWPELIDGFTYTEQEYLDVLSEQQPPHQPTEVDYNKFVSLPGLDICGRVNRGEIDEVWVYNAPWFGFYESRLVGPGAYKYNSPPIVNNNNCTRLIPIMGPSVERTAFEATHNFTHRAEATMEKVYGGWAQNRTDHGWDQFGLVKLQSPYYSYSGCGSSHWPPNAVSAEYDYDNLSGTLSNCGDFLNYPNLGDPLQVSQLLACSAWGCTGLGYNEYWFHHFPSFSGCGADHIANDWWLYFAEPVNALSPSSFCPANVHWISGSTGVTGTILSYTDGTPRTIMANSFGDYSLAVSDHWSGTITPSRLGNTFSPVNRSYTNAAGNLVDQNYTTQGGGPNVYYVNIATGDNSNSCTSIAAPCRNIQETINKTSGGAVIYVASGTYLFSTNGSPNVVIINAGVKLSGGWSSDFTAQTGVSIIDGGDVNNGILAISGNVLVENFIIENSISSNSGAIYIVNGNFTLKKSTLRNNVATINGAGIFLDNGVLNVVNSTISGNIANGSGGGIYASNDNGTSVNIQNSTIAYNQASTGGGISRTNGTYNITNTIIANNTSSTSNPDCSGTIANANFNIIENPAGCSITSGSNNLNVDPQLDGNLTGVMLVHMLLEGSPAVNAGTASGCPSTDQRGMTRPQGAACDIGAYEMDITRFAVIGDYGFAGQPELDVANRVKSWNPEFVITVGDNNYDLGSTATIDQNIGQYYHEFISPYAGLYGVGAVTNQFFPALGNHDWETASAQPYLNYFTLPGNERYYDYVQGPIHFFVIDSDPREPDGVSSISTQAVWLQNALAASTSPWNIVYMHHPPYSSGEHGSTPIMQWPFAAWGADAVLAGHDHSYERLFRDGIPYFVNGLGGKSLYRFRSRVFGSQLRYGADYGAMLVDATASQMIFKFITRTGLEIDSFALPNTLPQVDTHIAGNLVGLNLIAPSQSARDSYAGVNAGPVKVTNTNAVPIIVAERDAWLLNGVVQSFSEMMGLPADQLTDTYYFPWYNNVTMDTQLRLANLGNASTDITVTIAGVPQPVISLAVGMSTRVSYSGINNGPVKVQSSGGTPIIVAERDVWLLNGVVQSFSEMMGLPGDQLTDTYYFPWYNNVTMDTQLRFANLGAVSTDITVTIAGVAQMPITVPAGQSVRVSYPGINSGPVQVQSSGGVPIIVAERDAWLINGVVRSISEMMGLPANQLTDTYYFPWYNNVTMDTQLRFANLGDTNTDITVTIAGVAHPPITMAAGTSTRISYPGINNGPVKVQSSGGVPIIVAERDAWLLNGIVRSFSEMMGLPGHQLTDTYYFPWYNNVTMDTQLRFAVP